MTGQITAAIPVLLGSNSSLRMTSPASTVTIHLLQFILAVIISNAIAGLIEPSFFINIINIKKLPFLPDIISSSSAAYNVYVGDFMNSDVR